jgi:hypothetical protein
MRSNATFGSIRLRIRERVIACPIPHSVTASGPFGARKWPHHPARTGLIT